MDLFYILHYVLLVYGLIYFFVCNCLLHLFVCIFCGYALYGEKGLAFLVYLITLLRIYEFNGS